MGPPWSGSVNDDKNRESALLSAVLLPGLAEYPGLPAAAHHWQTPPWCEQAHG